MKKLHLYLHLQMLHWVSLLFPVSRLSHLPLFLYISFNPAPPSCTFVQSYFMPAISSSLVSPPPSWIGVCRSCAVESIPVHRV